MRTWMVDPASLCQQHLLGEHKEIHMMVGAILRGTSTLGYRRGLVDTMRLRSRHNALVREMRARGWTGHQTPLPDHPRIACHPVDVDENLRELGRRCPACRQRQNERRRT